MKKIKMITLVFFFIFMLSGCVESTTKMTIDKNKKVTVEATYLIENNYYDESYFDLSKYEKNGKTVEKVNAEEYSGFKVTKKYNSIDDISDSVGKEVYLSDFLGEEFDDSILFKVEKGFFKNIYTAKFKYDTTNADEGLENIESNDYDNSVNNNDIVLNDEDQTDVDNSYLDNPDVDLSQLQESLLKMKFEYILNL
ncbi:MAG: hypothetical protein GX758_01470, partial [Tenericutes bacterium]|nr:hypothetical protein [Mycoplasmatota bacterium]